MNVIKVVFRPCILEGICSVSSSPTPRKEEQRNVYKCDVARSTYFVTDDQLDAYGQGKCWGPRCGGDDFDSVLLARGFGYPGRSSYDRDHFCDPVLGSRPKIGRSTDVRGNGWLLLPYRLVESEPKHQSRAGNRSPNGWQATFIIEDGATRFAVSRKHCRNARTNQGFTPSSKPVFMPS